MSAVPSLVIEMRRPCERCGDAKGTTEEKNGQEIVRCATSGHYCYCRPKTESGKPQRTVKTRPTIKPSVRWRVIERDGHRCLSCGRSGQDVVLDVDHFLPLGHPLADDLTDSELQDDANLVTLCESCNLGKSESLPSLPSVFTAILRYYRGKG